MNILSLFDGMSCGQLALSRAGIKVDNYFASEIEPKAIQVTQHNFPNTIQLGSVTDVRGDNLPRIDLLFGGSPCQGFSRFGKGLNFEDPRSKLFFEFVRILKETSPKYFLYENVEMKKEWRDVITGHLGVEPIRINSSLVSAQSRVRWYWTNIPGVTQPEDRGVLLKDILEKDVSPKYNLSEVAIHNTLYHKRGKGFFYTEKSEKSGTIPALYAKTARDFSYITVEGKPPRKFTPLEVERLQTIPEGYTNLPGIANYWRYHMLGNGWTVDVIAHLLKGIEEA